MKEEEKASGIECHLSRLEKALEEIAAAAAEDTVENDRKKTDDAKAAEMRNRGCRKPERNTGKAAECRGGRSETKAKKINRSGGDTIAYLREKNYRVQKWKEGELPVVEQTASSTSVLKVIFRALRRRPLPIPPSSRPRRPQILRS